MGSEAVNLVCVQTNKPNKPNKTSPVQQQSNTKEVFENNNVPEGYDLVLVKRNDSAESEENVCKKEAPVETNQTANTNPCANNFLNLTMPDGLSMFDNSDIGSAILNLNRQPVQTAGASQFQNSAASQAGNSIYDVILQKAVQDYVAGKITKEELIKTQEEIQSLAEKETVKNESKENELKDKKLSSPQKAAINKFLSGSDNKTFTRDDFQKDEKISGAQTATQPIEELGVTRTVKVLSDGTRVEITEDKGKQGFSGALKGQRGGFGTRIVGAAEAIGGVVLGALTSWTGIGIAAGGAMVADGARRMYNGSAGSSAYTAVITRPDGSQKTIKNNYSDQLYNQLYKEIGIVK